MRAGVGSEMEQMESHSTIFPASPLLWSREGEDAEVRRRRSR